MSLILYIILVITVVAVSSNQVEEGELAKLEVITRGGERERGAPSPHSAVFLCIRLHPN